MVLTPNLYTGRFGGSVRGDASTGHSPAMYPRLSFEDVGEAALGARLAPELSVGGVESCALQDETTSTRIPLQLSVGEEGGRAGRLFSTVLQSVRVKVGEFGRRYATAAQVSFERDDFLFPE